MLRQGAREDEGGDLEFLRAVLEGLQTLGGACDRAAAPPRLHECAMAAPLWELAPRWWRGEAVTWWRRTYEEPLIPPVSVQPGTGQLVLASRREQ